jgi:putative ABC transport system permease protein
MILNYIKIALRTLWSGKLYSFINIFGLSVGLASCMLIILYAGDEVSFDKFHAHANDIYRITSDMTSPDGKVNSSGITGMMPGPNFKREVPGVEDFLRVQGTNFNIKHGSEAFEESAHFVDDNFFSFFSFPLLKGNPQAALNDIHSIVVSEDIAKKYFGDKDPMGKILELNTGKKFEGFTVTGVMKNPPQNSSLRPHILVPMKFSQSQYDDVEWVNFFLNTFVKVKPGSDLVVMKKNFNSVYNRLAADKIKEMSEKYGFNDKIEYGLQPLTQMHLSKEYPSANGLDRASNPLYTYILGGIALFILIIASINFINLTVARSLKRAREIGIRKAVGGQRKQLVRQFLGESYILCFVSFVTALVIVAVVLPLFNSIAEKELSFSYLLDVKLILGFCALYFISGLLAGFYPALVLSRFNPVQTLYGKFRFSGRNYFSQSLIVIQFALATFLIIGTIIIYSQFSYLSNYQLGYNDKSVLILKPRPFEAAKLDKISRELMLDPSVKNVSADQGGSWTTYARVNAGKEIQFTIKHVDTNYFSLFEIPLVAGRNFSGAFPSDSAQSVVINEAFAKEAGWKDPVGKVVDFFYHNKKFNVIGVVKDHHYESLTEAIRPELFSTHPKYSYGNIYVKYDAAESQRALAHAGKAFKTLFPFEPYQYAFKDAENLKFYESEAKWKKIITASALLTIIISATGLFGLSVLSAQKRAREISIRKVLGASVAGIARQLSSDFIGLVLLSSFIAVPGAWWLGSKWLQNYPLRVSLNPFMFAAAIVLVLIIALSTVSFHALRAATDNPVKNLRTE